MIAERLLWRHEVQDRLAEFGCVLIEEWDSPTDRYYTASYWRTEWGHHFVVPQIGPDGLVPERHLYTILAELTRLADEVGYKK